MPVQLLAARRRFCRRTAKSPIRAASLINGLLISSLVLLLAPQQAFAQSSGGGFMSLLFPFIGSKKPRRARPVEPRSQTQIKRLGKGRQFFAPFSFSRGLERRAPMQTERPLSGYRTMCVRTCDGYYWPISYGVTSDRFGADREVCHSTCMDETRLYFLPTHSDDMAKMRDLNGGRYEQLSTAFRYRKEMVAGCGCRPKPWTEVERARHKRYAAIERVRKLDEVEGGDWLTAISEVDVPGASEVAINDHVSAADGAGVVVTMQNGVRVWRPAAGLVHISGAQQTSLPREFVPSDTGLVEAPRVLKKRPWRFNFNINSRGN